MIAAARKDFDRDAADATGRAVDDDRPLVRRESVMLHPFDGEARGEAGSAQHHGVERRHPFRHGHDPRGRDTDVSAVPAVVRDTEIPTGDDGLVTRPEPRVGRRHDLAGNVDAGIAWKAPDDLSGSVVR